ncbi:AraC family transcriptional regulator [Vibrio sp. JC009]|uniref:helix-turn-helix transcriptional regulator n=1 Tax=Vibrio sp. JC009 TaxID=2912314 RepID=UPI0023B02790|nr:AraC family transcriptional regulator [Vibrio sp. JC009]WED24350.1 AraC family transcriptional regulator [Vibrio sp. JC009]
MARITIYKQSSFTPRKKDRYPVTTCGIILIEQGRLTYKTHKHEDRELKSGEYTIYHSDEFKLLESHPENGDFSAQMITFEPNLLQQFYLHIQQMSEIEEVAFRPLDSDYKIATQILELLADATKNHSSDDTLEALATALLLEIINVSPNHLPILQRACNQSSAQKVIRFIELNIENEVSLENTARFLGMSTATLKRRLSAEGLSFSQILKVKRVNYAADKLRLTSKSIADIAFESGFKSAAHFSTAFKGVQGITPKEFRQKICSGN